MCIQVCLLSFSPQHKHTVASYEDGAGDIDDPYDSSDSYGSSDPYDQHDSYGYDGNAAISIYRSILLCISYHKS